MNDMPKYSEYTNHEMLKKVSIGELAHILRLASMDWCSYINGYDEKCYPPDVHKSDCVNCQHYWLNKKATNNRCYSCKYYNGVNDTNGYAPCDLIRNMVIGEWHACASFKHYTEK